MTPAAAYYYGRLWREAYVADIGFGFSTKHFPTISLLCESLGWEIVDLSECFYTLAKMSDGILVVISLNVHEFWCVYAPEYVEAVAEVYKAVRASSRKKSMGRPPLPPGQKRQRLHISLPPDLAKLVMKDPLGSSQYIEKILRLAELPSD